MDDQPRPATTSPDTDYTLTIEDALLRYAHAGHPRTLRSIQRYCANGSLDCRRVEMLFGEKYLITPDSVAKHIAFIEEVRPITTGRGEPRQVATTELVPTSHQASQQEPTSSSVLERLAASNVWYIEHLQDESEFWHDQLTVKDEQIKDLTERARETNHLIAGLQNMLTPLLSRPSDTDAKALPPATPDIVDQG